MPQRKIGSGAAMYNRESTLQLLKKLAEMKAENYEINWEEWEDNLDSEELESMVNAGVEEHEEHFMNLSSDKYGENELSEDMAEELEQLIDDLIAGYIYQNMLQKKKAIEEFISSI